jgi:GntR family transcriptional regulator
VNPGTKIGTASHRVGRQIRYREIATVLRDRIASGGYPPGGLLPSEAELGSEFAVSRVTVRRALELLRDDDVVDARQGFGWFVAQEPLRQSLASLATIESQLAREGIRPERRILEFEFTAATTSVRSVLDTDRVLRVKRLNLADGQPFALVTVWCAASLAQHWSMADVEQFPFYELLEGPLERAVQTIGAEAASPDTASLLEIPVGSPVLRCRRVTSRPGGRPVLLSQHLFPAHRTEFVVELLHAEPSIAPSGLRLVDGA